MKVTPEVGAWIAERVDPVTIPQDLLTRTDNFLAGISDLSFNQVRKFSKSTHIPFGFFFLKRPPKTYSPLAEFRTGKQIAGHKCVAMNWAECPNPGASFAMYSKLWEFGIMRTQSKRLHVRLCDGNDGAESRTTDSGEHKTGESKQRPCN